MLNSFIERKEYLTLLKNMKNNITNNRTRDVVNSPFTLCKKCGHSVSKRIMAENLFICEKCDVHYRVPAYLRLSMIFDNSSFKELAKDLTVGNLLGFPDYDEKLETLRKTTRLKEAVVTAHGKIKGKNVVVAVMDSKFLMGSMGVAVGEKITGAVEYATKKRLPLVIFSCSGGARMQEGMFSLMQMAKTSAAIKKHSKAKLLYISILTNPTTGGVTASFASLGDIILAEPAALIGFAGPRVIEQTIKQKLPDGFQTSEYQLENGFLDNIVERKNIRETLAHLLKLHSL